MRSNSLALHSRAQAGSGDQAIAVLLLMTLGYVSTPEALRAHAGTYDRANAVALRVTF